MEDNTELLEKYIEEGKLPLKGELFSRKAKIAEKLRLYRELRLCLLFFWE